MEIETNAVTAAAISHIFQVARMWYSVEDRNHERLWAGTTTESLAVTSAKSFAALRGYAAVYRGSNPESLVTEIRHTPDIHTLYATVAGFNNPQPVGDPADDSPEDN